MRALHTSETKLYFLIHNNFLVDYILYNLLKILEVTGVGVESFKWGSQTGAHTQSRGAHLENEQKGVTLKTEQKILQLIIIISQVPTPS